VQENFLEDIGLDVDFVFSPGGKFTDISFSNSSASLAESLGSGVQGTLGGNIVSAISGGYGTILDDLQVSFVLNASQAHTDTTLLTAPKATVLSGESATFRVQRNLWYADDIDVEAREPSERTSSVQVSYDTRRVTSGSTLNITPTLSSDKKHVLLNITVQLRDFLGFRKQVLDIPVFGDLGGGGEFTLEFPETEISMVRTRVSVPDGGTLLLGGQKISADIEREASVPVVSRIPVLGRLFSNRSKVKDHKILLILVKPTVILHGEVEEDTMAALENEF
jgi:type II secretory pathway component GspD/PulD (secretin)